MLELATLICNDPIQNGSSVAVCNQISLPRLAQRRLAHCSFGIAAGWQNGHLA